MNSIPAMQHRPFDAPGNPRVHVAFGADPYPTARAALESMPLHRIAAGARVLLKPNAGRKASPGMGITTHPDVVAAAIDAFTEAGACVEIGESPITGVNTMEAFESSGIAEIARRRNCPLIDMDERAAVEIQVPDGKAVRRLQVCAAVLEHDLIVSIPVIKTHMHTGVTLAVKNMKGCLWRKSKVELHMIPEIQGENEKTLNLAIADMASVLRPHLALIDGTTGLEGLGPSAGTPRQLGMVLAGTDAFAADAVACHLIGLRPEDIPHLRLGASRGYGIIDLRQIEVTPGDWLQHRQSFAPAPENISIQFPNVNVLDRNSCSACQSTVLLFLQNHRQKLFDYFPKETPVNIAIGKGHDDLPPQTLCIGNCTARHRKNRVFVAGCPPVGSAILRALELDAPTPETTENR